MADPPGVGADGFRNAAKASAARYQPLRAALAALAVVLGAAVVLGGDAVGEARSAAPGGAWQSAQAGAVVRIDARLHGRAEASTQAWNPRRDTYDLRYVDPARWRLQLSGCRSTIDGTPVKETGLPGPAWLIEPLDGQRAAPITRAARKGACEANVDLPALGRWRIKATLSDSAGNPVTGSLAPRFRDLLVVAIGDSFASGEGNKGRRWVDTQCHRSDKAWPALVARGLENRSTTVTFLSVACSGADVSHVISSFYKGQEPRPGDRPLPPQLLALRAQLGDPARARTRQVDVLLGSIGINELDVSGTLRNCSIIRPFTSCKQDLSRLLATLPHAYDELELGLSARLRLARAYFAGYPAKLFGDENGGYRTCGPFFQTSKSSAMRLHEQVQQLNRHLSNAGRRHVWTVVPTEERFAKHGYCALGKWFVQRHESLDEQGNEDGTAHPNNEGHRQVAQLVRSSVRTDFTAPPATRFVLRLRRVRVTIRRGASWEVRSLAVDVAMGNRSVCGHLTERFVKLKADQWNDLSPHRCSRFIVETAGQTIALKYRTRVTLPRRRARPPSAPQAGGRLIRRDAEWVLRPAPLPGILQPTHRTTAHDGYSTVEFEYSIAPVPLLEPPELTPAG
jgi:hypothetical protein